MEFNDCIRLFLIRHGMTKWNQERRYLGFTDEPVIADQLTEYNVLREQLQQEKISTIYSSDLMRCQQTAQYLFAKSYQVDDRLREMHFGDWEGKTYEQLKTNSAYRQWLSDWENEGTPNGETGIEFRNRIQQFLEECIFKKENERHSIAVISHGGVIRQIVSSLCSDMDYWDVQVQFGQAIVLEIGGQKQCMSLSVVPTVVNGNM